MGKLANFFREQRITLDGQKKTKMLSLDRQFEEMEAERDSLKTENLNLRAQVKPLEREVERLKNQVEQNAAQSRGRLEVISEKMLVLIANGAERRLTKEQVIRQFGLSQAKGDHHFDILSERALITLRVVSQDGSTYGATKIGRQYLADHNLL